MKAQAAFTDHPLYARLCKEHKYYDDNVVPETVHIRQQPQGVTMATVHHLGFWNARTGQGLPRWRQLELSITGIPDSKVVQSLKCAYKNTWIRSLTSQLCTSGSSNLPSLTSVLSTVEWERIIAPILSDLVLTSLLWSWLSELQRGCGHIFPHYAVREQPKV